jgi:hypothetical protein
MSAAEGSGSTMTPGPTSTPTPVLAPEPVMEASHETPHSENLGMAIGLPIAACIFMVFSVMVNSKIQNRSISEIQTKAASFFEKLTIGSKGGLILGLMVLALVNGHASYVKDHPKQFMQDTVATAGFGAIAAGWLTFTRGRPDLFVNHFVFSLMLFFLYHVCREFAGYFTVFGNDKMSSMEQKQQNILSKPLLIAGGIGFLIAIGLAVVAHVSPDFSTGILQTFTGTPAAFMIETIVFVMIVTIGELIVAKNKQEPLAAAAGMSVALFTFAHLVLQGGGFYEHLYSAPPPCIS